ncbi:MAG: TldD/PmbA family protein [candidate division WOR-3 bacterium]|nr:MAG: TldD/PmbA family protein [candidate division WOR-3 bacterium]
MDEFARRVADDLRSKKVDYGDVRVVMRESESIVLKNGIIEAITHNSDVGFGVRVLKNSAWGFASSNEIKRNVAGKIVRDALKIALASATVKSKDIILTDLPSQQGVYSTRVEIDPFKISLSDKIDLLLSCDKAMRKDKRIKISEAALRFRKNRVFFASTDGSFIAQDFLFSGGSIKAYAMDKGDIQFRSYGDYAQKGFEFIRSMDFIKNAPRVADEALILLGAEQCPQMETTVIINDDQMVLQVHESCGHPAELDRVLGTEASYAGTSFLTTDKYARFQYGSNVVSIVADATVPGGLGTFGWDDEGVPGQRVYLIKNGMFVGYLTSRETAGIVESRSSGAMRADGWNRIPLIRMTNINLEPGKWKFEDMLDDTNDGVFMMTNKSWSIDDKRLNFQFGCEMAKKIERGKFTKVYKNPTYAGITPQFWNNCDAVANENSWRMHGTPNCGKGEPGQIMYVGHGTTPARFRNVQIGIAK